MTATKNLALAGCHWAFAECFIGGPLRANSEFVYLVYPCLCCRLKQHSRRDPTKMEDAELEDSMDAFENLPLYFMRFHGGVTCRSAGRTSSNGRFGGRESARRVRLGARHRRKMVLALKLKFKLKFNLNFS